MRNDTGAIERKPLGCEPHLLLFIQSRRSVRKMRSPADSGNKVAARVCMHGSCGFPRQGVEGVGIGSVIPRGSMIMCMPQSSLDHLIFQQPLESETGIFLAIQNLRLDLDPYGIVLVSFNHKSRYFSSTLSLLDWDSTRL